MKKILSLITILSFGCLYTNAQVTDGYYRVQTGKGNFISIVNNKIDNDNYGKVKDGQGGSVYSLRLKKQNEVISDAASIVKITNVTGQGLIIEGQGMNTKDKVITSFTEQHKVKQGIVSTQVQQKLKLTRIAKVKRPNIPLYLSQATKLLVNSPHPQPMRTGSSYPLTTRPSTTV